MALRSIGLAILVSLAITVLIFPSRVDGSPAPGDYGDVEVEVIPDTGAHGPRALRINRVVDTTILHDEHSWRNRHIVFWRRFCDNRKSYCAARYAGCENAPHFDDGKQCCYADEVLSKKVAVPETNKGEIYVTNEQVMCQEQLQKVKVCLKPDGGIEVRKVGKPEVLPGVVDCGSFEEKKKRSGSSTATSLVPAALLIAVTLVSIVLASHFH